MARPSPFPPTRRSEPMPPRSSPATVDVPSSSSSQLPPIAGWTRPMTSVVLRMRSSPGQPIPISRGGARARSRVAHPLEDRDLANLRWLQVVPQDSARARVLALDLDHRPRGRDQIDRQVMGGALQVLAQDLDRMRGGGDGGVVVDLAGLDQESVLEVGEAA